MKIGDRVMTLDYQTALIATFCGKCGCGMEWSFDHDDDDLTGMAECCGDYYVMKVVQVEVRKLPEGSKS